MAVGHETLFYNQGNPTTAFSSGTKLTREVVEFVPWGLKSAHLLSSPDSRSHVSDTIIMSTSWLAMKSAMAVRFWRVFRAFPQIDWAFKWQTQSWFGKRGPCRGTAIKFWRLTREAQVDGVNTSGKVGEGSGLEAGERMLLERRWLMTTGICRRFLVPSRDDR